MFRQLVDLLGEFVDKSEIPPTVTFQGTKFVGMDTNRTRLLELLLPTNSETRRISGFYEVEYGELKKLAKEAFEDIALHRVHNGKMIFKTQHGWNRKDRYRSISAERVNNGIEMPKVKNSQFKTAVEIAGTRLIKALQVAKVMGANQITLTANKRKQKLIFELTDDEGGYFQQPAGIYDGRIRYKGKAYFNPELLECLIPFLECWKCKIGYSKEFPMKISLEDVENGVINYLMAPIIIAD